MESSVLFEHVNNLLKKLARNLCSLVLQKSKLTEKILELIVLKFITGTFFYSIY